MTQARWFPPLLCAALAVALCFLTLPIVAIFVDTGPGDWWPASATRPPSTR